MIGHDRYRIQMVFLAMPVPAGSQNNISHRFCQGLTLRGSKRDEVDAARLLPVRKIAARGSELRDGLHRGTGRDRCATNGWRKRASVFFPTQLLQFAEQRREDVGLVIGDRPGEISEAVGALNDAAHTLETHAGVDMLRRQW